MIIGKIIKFYREKAGLTQGQLGEGICSVTHLSKIERGITEFSVEITHHLARRLGIDPEEETIRYHQLAKRLNEWHESMIMQRIQESEQIKKNCRMKNKFICLTFRHYIACCLPGTIYL